MARPRPRRQFGGDLSVSLFPFLSVLACVIGTLTLLIAALALGQVADELAQLRELSERDVEARQRGARISLLESSLAVGAELLEELERMRTQVAGLGPRSPEAATVPDESDSLEGEMARLAAASEELDDALRRMQTQFDELQEPPENARIQIQPSGQGDVQTPFFVECGANGLRIRRPDGGWSLPMNLDDVVDGPRFAAFLDRVRKMHDGTVIFLVRPSGIAVFRSALRYAGNHAVRHGKLALPGNGELDFSLF